ncbi:MAG: FecCD family ABC transporter permease [Acidaminococcus intestini]
MSGLLSFAPAPIMQQYFFWTLGSLGTASLKAWPLAGLILVLLPGVFIWGRPLNLLSLGGEQAAALGLNVAFWRKLILFWTALLTSLAVCLGGNIGFVGLIVPHMGRFLSGADHHRLLPFAALIGAVFLTFCDLMGRWILPGSEIRTGIITALLGSPYFLYLLHQKKGA